MFEDISNPVKGKGKEKDVGKRRAYVRVVTSLGGGSLNLELFCEKAQHINDDRATNLIPGHFRRQRPVTTFSCWPGLGNTTTAYFIGLSRDLW
jgi:hypothetical protein